MKDFRLNFGSLGWFITELTKMLKDSNKTYRVQVKEWRESRSLSQNALFHKWTHELSGYLLKRGRKDCTPDFCKDLLKHTFLGYEEKLMTNVLTGEKVVTSTLKRTSGLDVGEMTDFMNRCYYWAADIGCFLTIPEHSEYKKLMDQQND